MSLGLKHKHGVFNKTFLFCTIYICVFKYMYVCIYIYLYMQRNLNQIPESMGTQDTNKGKGGNPCPKE